MLTSSPPVPARTSSITFLTVAIEKNKLSYVVSNCTINQVFDYDEQSYDCKIRSVRHHWKAVRQVLLPRKYFCLVYFTTVRGAYLTIALIVFKMNSENTFQIIGLDYINHLSFCYSHRKFTQLLYQRAIVAVEFEREMTRVGMIEIEEWIIHHSAIRCSENWYQQYSEYIYRHHAPVIIWITRQQHSCYCCLKN